jgi:DNA-binding XRE family transcriptional regulator
MGADHQHSGWPRDQGGRRVNRANEAEMLLRWAKNLWWLRSQRRYSQEVLADRSEIHRTQISLLENGRRAPLLPTLINLAGGLDVPPAKLVEGITYSPPARGMSGRYVVEPLIVPGVGEIP